MYDRVLVPTDGSAEVEQAIRHAAELSATHGATLDTVYVVNTTSFATLPMESSWEGVGDVLRADGEAALDRVRAIAEEYDVPVEGTIRDGSPAAEIVRHAEDTDCDLIVMGTHGRGGIDRLLLGSVTERVVRSSTVPVLTVQVGSTPDSAREPESERVVE